MKREVGLKGRVVLLTIISMVALTICIQMIGYVQFSRNVMENYVKYASAAVNYADSVFQKYSLGDMTAARSMGEEYETARHELNTIKNSADIKYLYAVYFEDTEDLYSICYVINAKTDEELLGAASVEDIYSYMGERCEEGAFEENDLIAFRDAIIQDKKGIFRLKTNTDVYGNLLTCYKVIHDSKGKAVAILGVDIEISKIKTDLMAYLLTSSLSAAVIALLTMASFLFATDRKVTKPVMALYDSTEAFIKLIKDGASPEDLTYNKVSVRSRDEIFLLSENISSMASGLRKYMMNLQAVMAEKERIGAELNVATQIQADMLPCIFPPFPERKEFDIFASMTPAREVGGDFYDFFLLDDDHLALVMADVSGKGVPAALFMVISKTLIKDQAQICQSPKTILEEVNEKLIESNAEDMFVTVWLGIMEISTGHIRAVNAGHEYPAIRSSEGEFKLLKDRHGMIVGAMPGISYREYEIDLGKGECLFLYTDGVPEATNAENQLFGTDRMIGALNEDPMAGPEDLLPNVKRAVDGFVGEAPQFDDLTMLAIRRN